MSKYNDPFATDLEVKQATPIVPEVAAETTSPEISANEPRTRLSFKQTHALVLFCGSQPAQEHETWVSFAAYASEKLGFRVTTYSLQMALEAAERDLKTILKPASEETSIEKRLDGQQKQIDQLEEKVGLLKGIIDKILNQTVANEVA